jgi:very-short-patch-repair endonuclease
VRHKLVIPPIEKRIAGIAERQHGVVAHRQLLALGLSRSTIARWVREGWLHRVHRGVYAVGHARLAREGRYMAAVLACGDGAALSHFAAAVLWEILPERGPRVDVTVPARGGRARHRLVIVHRAALAPSEVATTHGIPLTTPTRTLIDLADVLPHRQLERAIDEAAYLRLDLTALRPRPGRRGAGRLARVLGEHDPGSTRTRFDLEERMLALCRRAELPAPDVNADVMRYEVDFVWREARLIVETDGWKSHGTRAAFERDRLRDAALVAAGWRVVRITWRRLERDPEGVARELVHLLGIGEAGSR